MSEELNKKVEELVEEQEEKQEESSSEEVKEENTQEVKEENASEEAMEEPKAEEAKEEKVKEEPKEEEKPAEENASEEPKAEEVKKEAAKEEPKEEEKPTEEKASEEPKEEKPLKEDKKKKDKKAKKEEIAEELEKIDKKKETPKKPEKKRRLSRKARRLRLIILITTVYLDAVIILLCSKYIGEFINGLMKLISGDMNGSIGNRKFTTSLLLLVVLIIINLISLSLYHDARKAKDKAPDDLLAMLQDTDSVDGHRIAESSYQVDEEDGKQVVYRNAKTIESINIVKVQETFMNLCKENGIDVDKSTARLVLSSIFASRLIIIKEKNPDLKKKFLAVIAKFFDNDLFLTTVADDATKFNDVVWRLTYEGNVQTEFSRGLNSSRNHPDRVNIVMLDNVKGEGIRTTLKEVLGYVKNPNIPCSLRIGNRNVDNGFRQIPKNVWFIFGMDEGEMIPSEVAKYSITLELNLKECEKSEEKTEFKPIDYPQVLDFLNDAYEEHFIQEDVWKKLDEFFEVFSRRGEYFIDNRIVREMERFAAVYLSLDGDQADLVDTLLSKKLLLIALPNEYKRIDVDEEGLVGQAEKILGADFVTNSSQLLKKIKID